MIVNVYLNFPGNTEEAFEFYRSVFGGEFASVVRFSDMPMEGVVLPEADASKIMHIGLPIGEGQMLMGTDALSSMGQQLTQGNNAHISVHPDSREEADRLFTGLSAGGSVEMPMGDQPWGDYYGSFRDKFGTQWMINHSSHA
jgi:PhnB protein